jgi:ribosomal protein S18 acetylase RimI-like enzyme
VSLSILPPERLTLHHDTSQFSNGKHPALDSWLKERALASEGLSARTYVVCTPPSRVVGYYVLSTAMEQRVALPSAKMRRNMPQQVPLILIGRLAVDATFQGRGLGSDLLADAIRRCCAASEIAGVRAIVAHAIDEEAVGFYRRRGFILSPLGERIMLLPLETAKAAL